jgi:hypothetical protein
MGARSYVPGIGRFLQPDPVPGGTDNPYAYTDGNPVNETDLTGAFVEGAYLYAFNAEENVRSAEREAAREQAAREEAERKAAEAAAIAAMDAKMATEEAAVPQWIREYAMGGPSLDEIDGSEGIIPGGGMVEEEGGGGDPVAHAASGEDWGCAIDDAIVAVGVGATAPTAGFSDFVSAVASAAFGLATEGTCSYLKENGGTLISGLPRTSSSGCFNTLTISKRNHKRDHRIEECYA